MATRDIYTNHDFQGVGQLLNVRLHNVDNAAETALAGTLGAANEGLVIYNTEVDQIKTWDGAQFNAIAIGMEGDVVFKGFIDASLAFDDVGQPQPIEAVAGYEYVVTTSGTFDAGATGITLQGKQALEVGDKVLFTSATTAYAFQRNDIYATETEEGNIRLATQAEVDAGVEATEAVTPATLQEKLDGQFYTKQYTEVVTLVALTPLTVTHNLGLVNRDAFTVNTMRGNATIGLRVESVDANSIQLESLLGLSDVTVTIVGAVAV